MSEQRGMDSDRELRVGIIGCGNIAREHATYYRATAGCRLVAGVERHRPNAEAFQEQFPEVAMFDGAEEMLSQCQPDLVSVCTWPRTHARFVVECARHGVRGILCEKPMEVSLTAADEMLSACRDHRAVLGIDYQHRYDANMVAARQLVADGAIGALQDVWGHCSLDLMNNGAHVVDQICFLNDDVAVEWVMGQVDVSGQRIGQANHPDMPVEDFALGRFVFENGVRVTVELGALTPPHYHFRLVGEEGIIEINVPSGPPLRMMNSAAAGWQAVDVPRQEKPSRQRVIEELAAAVWEGRQHAISGEVGRRSLEILIGILESARSGGVVHAPVSTKDFPLETMVSGANESVRTS